MELVLVIVSTLTLALAVAVLIRLGRISRGSSDAAVRELVDAAFRRAASDQRQDSASHRSEVAQLVDAGHARLNARLQTFSDDQRTDRHNREAAAEASRVATEQFNAGLRTDLATHFEKVLQAHGSLQERVGTKFEALRESNEVKLTQVQASLAKLQEANAAALDKLIERVQNISTANSEQQEKLRRSLQEELEKLRAGNEAKLEKMRETVDEKLQGTLEKRLGESFAQVSERLELVHRGLGEMQTLATDVGGLKRVLTNVKSRGSWGEVQLERQLEDMLTQDQFDRNVAVRPGGSERVEFAVRLPGKGEDVVYLAIDSKLPHEDYERLLTAQEGGDKADIDQAGKALERAIVTQAKVIADKYISPPNTTDFAIMYLPTEGLFAEVVRRPGLASKLQNEHRVLVTGPTTLMSLLNSLQMGFKTLAIEKRSSEVWKVLGAAKAEFAKFGTVWEKLDKQLATAQKTVQEVRVRTGVVARKLRDVESIEEAGEGEALVESPDLEEIAETVGISPSV